MPLGDEKALIGADACTRPKNESCESNDSGKNPTHLESPFASFEW
jgi:hypothetical protein